MIFWWKPSVRIDIKYVSSFEKSFPYIETPDQKNAISDVYKDMALPGLMDRLIIGDVGFGKTEVAIRAAVRSVVSGGFGSSILEYFSSN